MKGEARKTGDDLLRQAIGQGFQLSARPAYFNGSTATRSHILRVIARSSTAKYSSDSGDVRAIGKELGARYIMEGSLRQAGSRVLRFVV
jgi:predicted phage gp36 major capsid-like protein